MIKTNAKAEDQPAGQQGERVETAKPSLGKRLRDFWQSGQLTTCLIFLPPALLLFTIFVSLPVIEAGYYGFFNWNGYGPPTKWINLQNYVRALSDPIFHNALFNNVLVVLVSALIQVPLALGVALLISDRSRSSVIFQSRIFSPVHSWRSRGRSDLAVHV